MLPARPIVFLSVNSPRTVTAGEAQKPLSILLIPSVLLMCNEYRKCAIDMSCDNSNRFGDCPKPKKSKTSEDKGTVFTSNWAHLPSIVIHEIFDHLDRTDRKNASTVCRHWRQSVYHPKWWPSMTFKIEPHQSTKSRFLTSVFGKTVSEARILVNTLMPQCTDEFVALIEVLGENNHLKELIIEPTHCRYYPKPNIRNVIESLKSCLPNLTKFSIGCIEDFAHYFDEYLTILARKQAHHLTHLGFASVKDNPNEYEACHFECDLIRPFTNLKVLSIDFDILSDHLLECLENSKHLERLVVHLHGIRDGHPGTTSTSWARFTQQHPNCGLRINVIHSYVEIGVLHETVLKEHMPLTHLKVFFCESVNMAVLEFLSAYYASTLRSIIWVDSLSDSKESWSFVASHYDNSPDPLIMISWLCKNLEELVFYGYKYSEENLIAIARLRGEKLKRFEIVQDDILYSIFSSSEHYLVDIPLHLKRPWAPLKTADLHPVICNPTAGDSDEYLLPIVLADLH